jgi:hypothetical protein
MYSLLKIVQGSAFPSGLYRLEDGILSGSGVRVNLAEQLVSVQIISSVDQLNRTYSGTLASGVVGFALLGPLGAVGGMLVGGRKKHIQSTISMGVLDDGRVFLVDGTPSNFASLTTLASSRNRRVNLIDAPVTKNFQISNSMKSEVIPAEMQLKKKTAIKLKPDERKCPSCFEIVKSAAIKCRHCKSNI